MVEVNATVCCPICEEKIELNKMFSKSRDKPISYSLAEFERHMENHTDSSKSCLSLLPVDHSSKLKKSGDIKGKYLYFLIKIFTDLSQDDMLSEQRNKLSISLSL